MGRIEKPVMGFSQNLKAAFWRNHSPEKQLFYI
jgi:hypothetical protein